MNILEHHLPKLIQRAERLEVDLAQGLSMLEANSDLNSLNAYWVQISDLALKQQVILLDYELWITRLERSIARSRAHLMEQGNHRSFWSRLLDFSRAVLNFLGFRSASRLLGAAQQFALPANSEIRALPARSSIAR